MFYKLKEDKILLLIKVKPNAKNSDILSINEEFCDIRISAKPKNGEANKELKRYLSDTLKIAKTYINIIKSDKSRIKKIEIPQSKEVLDILEELGYKYGRESL